MTRRRVRIARLVAAPMAVSTLLLAAAVFAQGAPTPPPPPLPGGPTDATPPPPVATAAPAPTPAPLPPPPPTTGAPAATPATGTGAAATGGATVSMDGAAAGMDAEGAAAGSGQGTENDEEIRSKSLHETPTPWGPTGLLHTPSALTREAGTFGVGFFVDWFKSSSFLCTAEFPCGSGSNLSTSDTHSHIGAAAVISATFVTGLEGYITGRVYANSNDQGKPQLLQVLGDTTLGLKYVRAVGSGVFNVGGGAEAVFLNGTGGIGLSGEGTSFRLRALSTLALDKGESKTPLRFHLGLAYYFDNSGNVVKDVEDARTARAPGGQRQQITRIERYGLGINKVDRFEVGIGGEALLADDKIRPFLEYTMWLPVNRQSYECPKPTVVGTDGGTSDGCLAEQGFSFLPSKISIGAKAYPFSGGLKGLSFLAGLDIGVTGVSKFISETAPQAPYTIWLGLALTADTVEPPPKIVEKAVEKRVEVQVGTQLVHVKGFVHEVGQTAPIANAIVMPAGLAPLATGADGTFHDDVPAGSYSFTIKADGFKEGTCAGTAVAPPKPGETPPPAPPPAPGMPPAPQKPGVLEIDCALEALPKVGNVSLAIVDADGGAGLSGINVTVTDAANSNPRSFTSDASGIVRIEALPPGTYYAAIDTDGYFATKQPFEARVREDLKSQISLRLRPKDKLVTVDKTEVKIKQQIHFATDKATILGDSIGLLEEIADVLIKTPRLKKIEIQGHTDNAGTPDHNMQLSIDRAEAVKKFLVDHGVDGTRLETHGFGDKKPVAPNINEAGKQKNRRVQFVIMDQDPAPPEEKKPAKPKK